MIEDIHNVLICKIAVALVSGLDVDDCVSDDTDTICGDVSDDNDYDDSEVSQISTQTSMPQLDTVSPSESESDFEVGEDLAWGCKILPKFSDDEKYSSSNKVQVFNRRYFSTECDMTDNQGTSKTDFVDFEQRRSMPCIFTTSQNDAGQEQNNHNSGLESLYQNLDELGSHRNPSLSHSHSSSCCTENSDKSIQSDLSWIDRTPSESSLQLPFCPPIRVDYEDFPSAFPKPMTSPQPIYAKIKRCPDRELKRQQKIQTCVETSLPLPNLQPSNDNQISTAKQTIPPVERLRRSKQPPDRELTIIPIEESSEFYRAIPSPVIPLQSSSTTFTSCSDVIYQCPPGYSDSPKIVKKKSHFVEIVIQISPPLAFSAPILPPPPSFSTTVTRPYFPRKASNVISRNSQSAGKMHDNSIRSSLRDSGLADISPHVGRRHPDHLSSSHSFINSASPTSGLSSDETGTSLTGLATPPTRDSLSRQHFANHTSCCFHSKRPQKCLPFNLLSKRRTLRRERSQSLDDSTMLYYNSTRPNLDSESAISCLDLPLSSLSTDIYEDEEDCEEMTSSYRSALYAHWWLKAPFKKQTDL